MTIFCRVEAEITVDGKVRKAKVWPECDIMKTSVTVAWTTRQFNLFLKEYARGGVETSRDKIIRAWWEARYGEAQGHTRFTGSLSGVNGHVMARHGVFED